MQRAKFYLYLLLFGQFYNLKIYYKDKKWKNWFQIYRKKQTNYSRCDNDKVAYIYIIRIETFKAKM